MDAFSEILSEKQWPIRRIVIAPGLIARAPVLLREVTEAQQLVLLADAASWDAAGQAIADTLATCPDFRIERAVFSAHPHADLVTAETLIRDFPQTQGWIAVGSGTLSDLGKYAAAHTHTPLFTFGTAPSMNGYASPTASLHTDGLKTSLPACVPAAIFLDTDICAAAPRRLILSGLGDSLCRPTAQADWLLAHRLFATPYHEEVFAWLDPYETALLESATRLAAGNQAAVRLLLHTLIASGLGMYASGGSHPASQGEHALAHTLELLAPAESSALYHGEQIAITTAIMLRLQTALLACDDLPQRLQRPNLAALTAHAEAAFPPALHPICHKAIQDGFGPLATSEGWQHFTAALSHTWPRLQEEIAALHTRHTSREEIFTAAALVTKDLEPGWPPALIRQAMTLAPLTRARFGFLHLNLLLDKPYEE